MKECSKCRGCGKVANTEQQESWLDWAALPLQSATAVVLGFVRPIVCPLCDGSGDAPRNVQIEFALNQAINDVEWLLDQDWPESMDPNDGIRARLKTWRELLQS